MIVELLYFLFFKQLMTTLCEKTRVEWVVCIRVLYVLYRFEFGVCVAHTRACSLCRLCVPGMYRSFPRCLAGRFGSDLHILVGPLRARSGAHIALAYLICSGRRCSDTCVADCSFVRSSELGLTYRRIIIAMFGRLTWPIKHGTKRSWHFHCKEQVRQHVTWSAIESTLNYKYIQKNTIVFRNATRYMWLRRQRQSTPADCWCELIVRVQQIKDVFAT